MKIWVKKNSLAAAVLRSVATTSLAIVAASSPYFGLGLLKGFKKHVDKKAWRRFYASLNYLNRRGYVKILKLEDGNLQARLTRQGKSIVESLNIDSLKLPHNEKWDGKWRLVMFDVPNKKSGSRRAFSNKLGELGFIMVQKSVWAYPFECYKEIAILRKFYEIEKFVIYAHAVEIEDELEWRGKFNLKNREWRK